MHNVLGLSKLSWVWSSKDDNICVITINTKLENRRKAVLWIIQDSISSMNQTLQEKPRRRTRFFTSSWTNLYHWQLLTYVYHLNIGFFQNKYNYNNVQNEDHSNV